jgi:hypothetical protein
MLEQESARPVLQNVTSADPGYAQLANLIRKRTQQIKLRIAGFRHAGFPSPAAARRNGDVQRREHGVEFRFAPQARARFALERNHTHFFAPNSIRCNSGS